ncbi:MAG: zinc-ribbon domain-containing protein [Desulfobacterales bacterium]
MEIICDNCQKKMNVPDSKIPKDRVAYLKCPGCENRLALTSNPQQSQQKKQKSKKMILQDLLSDTYDATEKPFDFLEEEAKTSLVCVSDLEIVGKINPVLSGLEYHNTLANSARDALKKMRYHNFDLVILDELFDCKNYHSNGVLIYLQQLPMALRRNLFLVMLTNRFRTMDNMEAFHKSVNLIVNVANISEFKKILLRGIADNEVFYKVFKNASKKIRGI